MITRTHYSGIKNIGLRLESLRQNLERIIGEIGEVETPAEFGLSSALNSDYDDLDLMVSRINDTAHSIAKHLGVEHHDTHDC